MMITFAYDHKQEIEMFETMFRPGCPLEGTRDAGRARKMARILKTPLPDDKIESLKKRMAKDWQPAEEIFLEKLGEFYEKKLVMPDIVGYMTRSYIWPYDFDDDPPWFAVPINTTPIRRNKTIRHELVHYFQPVKLSPSIKEAIPVILNDPAFQMQTSDDGHDDPVEQQWRKKIWKIYKAGSKFSDVIKRVKKSNLSSN